MPLTWTKPERGLWEGAYHLPDGTRLVRYWIATAAARGNPKRYRLQNRNRPGCVHFPTLAEAKAEAERRQAAREHAPTFPPLLPGTEHQTTTTKRQDRRF